MYGLSSLRPLFRAPTSSILRSFSTTAPRDFARLTVVGNLGAPPALEATSTGREVVRYTVATSYGSSENRKTSWFRVNCYLPDGPVRAHLLNLPKGSLLTVEADANTYSVDNEDGSRSHGINFTHRNFEVLKRGRTETEGEQQQQQQQ
ncbi:hypothetical protein AJ80_08297 [Polytolypa hystricis UAMH7299]|uniref:SsDNA binding protein n=1 Tax=Polytolypa hystricis (strain UAMH7299) TaxID=1447883 RepID=A0A2B7XA35_POLH7|nr:hypothetical protein AJ80_08297 [Polytolypa hystricis UAMH7299]